MKYLIIISVLMLCTTALYAYYNHSVQNGIETYNYKILDTIEHVEIRQYEGRYFNTVKLNDSTYKESSGQGFRILAGYIFGANETNKKISMTSPVVMDMNEQVTMKFMVPASEDISNLPEANDNRIELEFLPSRKVAVISFGGWANNDKIKNYASKLFETLDATGIEYADSYSYFGYNPPYQLLNRKNEIVVELK